jgi:hypothetical protein
MTSLRNAAGILAGIALLDLYGCTSGQVGQYPVTQTNPATDAKLQFAVGWATAYAGNTPQSGALGYGINLVETFRESSGRSAVLNDSVVLAVPPALGKLIGAQAVANNKPFINVLPLTTLDNVEAFGAGLNDGSFPSIGDSFQPDNGAGGPPAFPPPADGTSVTQQFSEGYFAEFPITTFEGNNVVGLPLSAASQAFPGPYTLDVTVPTGKSSTEVISANATLGGAPLPAISAPDVAPDNNGGALVSVTVPAGVTETIVTISGTACQPQTATAGASPPPVPTESEVYTLVSHVAGPNVAQLSLPDFVTPIGGIGTYVSLCTAAQDPEARGYTAYAVGFDYPAFESVYPQNFSETPTIVGATHQSDITISGSVTGN